MGIGESSRPNWLSLSEENLCQKPTSTKLWNGENWRTLLAFFSSSPITPICFFFKWLLLQNSDAYGFFASSYFLSCRVAQQNNNFIYCEIPRILLPFFTPSLQPDLNLFKFRTVLQQKGIEENSERNPVFSVDNVL